jgi:hypothetical protein
VPQRVDAERPTTTHGELQVRAANEGQLVEGAQDFIAEVADEPRDTAEQLRRLSDWALRLERERLVRLQTYRGKTGKTLLPKLRADNVGLVTIWHDKSGGYLQFWRSVFERRAPTSLPKVEQAAAPAIIGQGTVTHEVTDELLNALTDAYREAATGRVSG